MPFVPVQEPVRAEFHTVSPAAYSGGAGATVVDLSRDPYDLSPATGVIVAKVQEALAADQNVIVLLGEAHSAIAHVRLAEALRLSLKDAGVQNLSIAREQQHNLAEYHLPNFFPGDEQSSFRAWAARALGALKAADPQRYHRLQALACAASNWRGAPVANLENAIAWLQEGVPVRPVDVATTGNHCLNPSCPETRAAMAANQPGWRFYLSPKKIHAADTTGMRIRNSFMADKLTQDMKSRDSDRSTRGHVVLLKTGLLHLGGQMGDFSFFRLFFRPDYPYPDSLHSIFARAAQGDSETGARKTRIITVFPESRKFVDFTFKGNLSSEAQAAMNNPDTIILRGVTEDAHEQKDRGSFSAEIATLEKLSGGAGDLKVRDEDSYHALRATFKEALKREVEAVTEEYTPRELSLLRSALSYLGLKP